MSILRMSPLTPPPSHHHHLSSLRILTPSSHLTISHPPHLPFHTPSFPSTIRMGGGPRTFPGGVSKWQWKRMQAKKAKQLLKARLSRERQIYEMRKRAELRAAVTELERPWEVVERAPTLFSVSADEQLKTLADRFQKPGGYDLWSHRDGPQLFSTADGLPSARFFPKGVVHSVKPYGRVTDSLEEEMSPEGGIQESFGRGRKGPRRRRLRNSSQKDELDSQGEFKYGGGGGGRGGGFSSNDDGALESTSTSMKNLRISDGRDDMNSNIERGRKNMSASFNGGRGGANGSSRGRSRNQRNGRNVGLRGSNGLESERTRFDTDGRREEAPLLQRGRGGSTVNQFNNARSRSRSKTKQASEVYDMSLKEDGSYELQTNQQKHLLKAGLQDALEFDSY